MTKPPSLTVFMAQNPDALPHLSSRVDQLSADLVAALEDQGEIISLRIGDLTHAINLLALTLASLTDAAGPKDPP